MSNGSGVFFYFLICRSPDGKYLLSNAEDHLLRMYEVYVQPSQPCSDTYRPGSTETEPVPISPLLKVSEGEDIYDYAWYPLMRSEGTKYNTLVNCCSPFTRQTLQRVSS